jgi:hypothetical protein
MSGQGTSTLNFGAFPGATDATVVVTGQAGILATSLVEAWIFPAATADHTVDEHWVDPPEVFAGSVIAGTGFTIYGVIKSRVDIGPQSRTVDYPRVYGSWTVAWVWN